MDLVYSETVFATELQCLPWKSPDYIYMFQNHDQNV